MRREDSNRVATVMLVAWMAAEEVREDRRGNETELTQKYRRRKVTKVRVKVRDGGEKALCNVISTGNTIFQ